MRLSAAADNSFADNAPAGSSSLTLRQAPGAGCLQVGDEVLIIAVQGGDANDVSGVGTYETGSIDAISEATLTLERPLANSYTTVDGTGHPEAVMVQRVPNYTDVTIDSGATLATSAFGGSTGGALFLRATGTVTVNGTIEADGLGYSGGQATPPSDSDVPASTGAAATPALDQNASNDQGGGGPSSNATGVNDSTGGGGGANGGAADAGIGGPNDIGSGGTPSISSLTTLLPGGGGGAGGVVDAGCSPSGDALPGGRGGDGGGVIVITANVIVDNGTISADGTDGAQRPLDPSDPDPGDSLCGGGGGGGAGGSVFLSAVSDVNLAGGAVSASGGNGGDGVQFGGAGGAGGGGSVLLSSGSTTELGADAVTALGGQPGIPLAGGASAGGGSSGAVELWEPPSATDSGTSNPPVAVQPLTGYEPRGELTSSIFDSGMAAGAVWDAVADTATTPAGTSVSVRVRTGQDADMSDAPSFGSCPALSGPTRARTPLPAGPSSRTRTRRSIRSVCCSRRRRAPASVPGFIPADRRTPVVASRGLQCFMDRVSRSPCRPTIVRSPGSHTSFITGSVSLTRASSAAAAASEPLGLSLGARRRGAAC